MSLKQVWGFRARVPLPHRLRLEKEAGLRQTALSLASPERDGPPLGLRPCLTSSD